MFEIFFLKKVDLEDLLLQKHEAELKEEEKQQEEAEVMAANDWPREQEVEISDWPTERVCHTHERAIPIQETVEALDVTEEGMWTCKHK